MREIKAWFGDLENISKEIEKHISKTYKRLEKAPEGTLRVSKTHGKSQFYIKTELYHHGKYLAKKDRSLAGRLAQKDYDNKLLKALEDQKKAIDRFLKDYDPDAAEQVYEKLSEQRKALVTPEFLSDEEFIRQFLSQPYTRPGFKSTDPEFYTDNGERVCVITDKVAARTGTSTGGTVRVNSQPFRVVGVVKAVSAFLEEATADIYVPYMVEGMDLYPNNRNPLRNGDNYVDVTYEGNLNAQILLREGYALKDFLAELEPLRQNYSAVISSQLGKKVEWAVMARTHFFHKINFFRPDGADDQGLALETMNLMPPAILMLLFLFLPAINLSGLVSNRMEARRAEMGIRKAFGAKRRTLLNEVISENLVLTLLGGIVGWVLSALFVSAISDNKIFLQMFVSADQSVVDTGMQFQMFFTPTLFLIVFVCCVLLNLMAALIPAWHSLRKPIVESLNQKR